MRTLFRNYLAVSLILALTAGSAMAQTSRRGSTTSTNTNTATTSTSTSRSSSTAATTTSRGTSTAATTTESSRSSQTATQVNRGSSSSTSTSRGTSTAATTTTSTSRSSSTAATTTSRGTSSPSTSTESSRSSQTATQVNNGTTTSRGTSTTGTTTTVSRSGSTTTSEASRPTSAATTSTSSSRSSNSNVSRSASADGTTASRSRSTTADATSVTTTTRRNSVTNDEYSRGLTSVTTVRSSDAVNGVPQNIDSYSYLRMDNQRNVNRIPPRERIPMTYDRPCGFHGVDPHFYGYRVEYLPPRYRKMTHWGVTYYYYNDVYYRMYNNHYVVCRPPYGVTWKLSIFNRRVYPSVRFSYYSHVYRPFSVTDANWVTIARQNEVIARNNAILMQQNMHLALNANRALSAYEIANRLGLVQSYAYMNTEYYYQDGIFFISRGSNRYEVIVPPAGALVDELPDDYDIIVLDGVEYYKVDDTVYRLVLVDGAPLLEVLGQMYGTMAHKYNFYF
ncbi:MAG: DUF6515 family protein [Bacteroidales bacterium]|nr:DUF6515 family protein [Bacteroidales bacterium]